MGRTEPSSLGHDLLHALRGHHAHKKKSLDAIPSWGSLPSPLESELNSALETPLPSADSLPQPGWDHTLRATALASDGSTHHCGHGSVEDDDDFIPNLQDIQNVRESWKTIHSNLERRRHATDLENPSYKFAHDFYAKLFAKTPDLKRLFHDMQRQIRAFGGLLETIVNRQEEILFIQETAIELGRRHFTYGVKIEMFQPMVSALIETLREHGENEFTPEIESSWVKAIGMIVRYMKEGLLDRPEDPPERGCTIC
ncbi:hypothetical protein HK102_002254 [Quaeritorhiza haematococci]|nr:hypothetical protein HK102_002254 [Quaeritorhiza haematococci]